MSSFSSRRRVLSATGAAVVGALAGCLDTSESEDIDITVSNASDTGISYEVLVEAFEETGVIEVGGTDQYDAELSQPSSSSQFEVVATFETQGADDSQDGTNGSNNETDGTEADGNETDGEDSEAEQFERTISLQSDVVELSVTYTGGQMTVNPVVEND
ncbi:hypothetical protein [Halovenus sp. HT40]|uniref:hypothetical protein n=1 Tax=Halovenus sp. HT40 TaxID=3126691 RepID=UPI00300EDD74